MHSYYEAVRVFWNIFIILTGVIGITAGILFAIWTRAVPPVSYLLIFGGMALILAPIFRWALTPSTKRHPTRAARPAPHAPHHRYGAFEVKTGPGPRDWRPPTSEPDNVNDENYRRYLEWRRDTEGHH